MMIKGKFLRAEVVGEKIAEKLCQGWTVTTVIEDRFGNGHFEFDHDDCCTVVVDFTEINVNDEVTLSYNGLSEIVREY